MTEPQHSNKLTFMSRYFNDIGSSEHIGNTIQNKMTIIKKMKPIMGNHHRKNSSIMLTSIHKMELNQVKEVEPLSHPQ